MRTLTMLEAMLATSRLAGAAFEADPRGPMELSFALSSTERAAEITRRLGAQK